MITTACPACEGPINLPNHPVRGQRVRCPHCYEDLTIIATEPVELGWPYDDVGWGDESGSAASPEGFS